jgi:hypothetical protein
MLKTEMLKYGQQMAFSILPFSLSVSSPRRLNPELWVRTKAFASLIIRTYIQLPRKREEVAVLRKQMLRAGTSVPARAREASRARSAPNFVPNSTDLSRRPTCCSSGSSYSSRTAELKNQPFKISTLRLINCWQFSQSSLPRSDVPSDFLSAFQPFSFSAFQFSAFSF